MLSLIVVRAVLVAAHVLHIASVSEIGDDRSLHVEEGALLRRLWRQGHLLVGRIHKVLWRTVADGPGFRPRTARLLPVRVELGVDDVLRGVADLVEARPPDDAAGVVVRSRKMRGRGLTAELRGQQRLILRKHIPDLVGLETGHS